MYSINFFQFYFSRIASNILFKDDNKKDKQFVNANSGGHTQKASRKSSLQNIELQRFTIYHRYKTFGSDTQSQ